MISRRRLLSRLSLSVCHSPSAQIRSFRRRIGGMSVPIERLKSAFRDAPNAQIAGAVVAVAPAGGRCMELWAMDSRKTLDAPDTIFRLASDDKAVTSVARHTDGGRKLRLPTRPQILPHSGHSVAVRSGARGDRVLPAAVKSPYAT